VLALAGAAQVIAFEPLPENAKALERLAELNTDLPITIERLALGRSDGRAAFNVMPEQSMGKLSNSPFQIDATPIREIEVELARLDTLVFERAQPRPNLIKIDVEGAEVEVLAGAIRTLTECRPRVYLEAHSTALEQECTAQLVAQGYRVRRLEEGPLNLEDTRHLIAQPA
jgi:FkbM family methyltransferase